MKRNRNTTHRKHKTPRIDKPTAYAMTAIYGATWYNLREPYLSIALASVRYARKSAVR